MQITIQNEQLQLTVDTRGAEMRSIQSADGTEYLWQGDPAYWSDRSPVLFPFIGRLEGKAYCVHGVPYSMDIHGFAWTSEFTVTEQTTDSVTLTLTDSRDTKAQYPFAFTLSITYRLAGSTIAVENRVENRDDQRMYFALGGHPGFRVPLTAGEQFEDYYLEFSRVCHPDRIGFTGDTILLNGQNEPYPLADGKRLPLRHDLFDEDAVILQHMARQIALKSHHSTRSVTVTYPDMPYLGIWHWPKTDAPYVCIEPWSSLPGRTNTSEELSARSDLLHLEPRQVCENTWCVSIQ